MSNAGHALAAIDRMIGQLCVLLQDGPLPHRAIEARLAPAEPASTPGRLAIKVAWERGTISYVNAATAWNREARTFALTPPPTPP